MTEFRYEWEDHEARRLLDAALAKGVQLRPLLVEIGYELVRSTQERIDAEQDPDGIPWVDLRPATWARKRTDSKLVERGYLRGGIALAAATNAFVEISADRDYAAIHQFGGTPTMAPGPAAVPARPYLGLSDADGALIESLAVDFLNDR